MGKMMKKLDEQIQELYEEVKRREKIGIHLSHLDDVVVVLNQELKQLEIQLNKEDEDVKKLENLNLYSIFNFILGKKEQQLEKERQEYLQVFMRHKATVERLVAIEEEREMLKKLYSGGFSRQRQLMELLKQKEAELKAENSSIGEQLVDIEQRIASHKAKNKEIFQVISEGKRVKSFLEKTLISLGKINEWGAQNNRTIEKRNNEAGRIHKHISMVNKHLRRFEDELYDISHHHGLDFHQQVETIKDFLDQFVESLITDWIIRQKIQNSLNLVQNSFDKITLIINMLTYEVKKTKEYIEQEEQDKKDLILGAIE